MRILPTFATGIAFAVLTATSTLAQDAKTYAVPSKENYCPAGLQPVTVDGSICCGVPNQSISYQQAMQHPVRVKHVKKQRSYSARAHCPAGTKGCS
ncbi:hypothetical protein O4H61_07560 [Roseovarius aestuarii]|nr:hypothetical protein [Roseovarius aestuarii]